MNLRTNAGYIIADSIRIGDTEFVLGVSVCQQPALFVTWQCKGGDNYFWGHYHDDLLKAKKDLLNRASEELEALMERREQTEAASEKQDKEREQP